MADARLLIESRDGRVLLVDGRLPRVGVSEVFSVAELLRQPVAIVRTLTRDGDDRVVLLECVDPSPTGTGTWVTPDTARRDREAASAIEAASATVDLPIPPWMERGWMADTMTWASSVAATNGCAPPSTFAQLKHWGLSAVVRFRIESGDIVVKQVPHALAAEGPVTAALASIAPGRVPTVLAVDGDRFAMAAFEAEPTSVEPSGLQVLADLQHTAAAHVAQLVSAGCREQRAETLAAHVDALLARDDLLFERSWQLSSTDGRRPPRDLEPTDVARIRGMLETIERDAAKLAATAPPTVVHGDFHPLNVASVAGSPLILDWGTASVGDPRTDLPTWQQLAATSAGVDDYLHAWTTSPDDWQQLVHLAYFANALTCAVLADAMIDANARKDWAAAVQKRLLEAAELAAR